MIQKYVKLKDQDWKHVKISYAVNTYVHTGFTYRSMANLANLIVNAWDSAHFIFIFLNRQMWCLSIQQKWVQEIKMSNHRLTTVLLYTNLAKLIS